MVIDLECEEPLCADCEKHHNVLKATRNHKTISIADYQLLPSVVTDIKQNCVYHNEMYQLYCIKHESPICNKCVKDHGKCGEILLLDEIVKNIKTSESFFDLEESLDDLFTNINLIRKDRESNIENITDQKKKITAHVCHLKQQVIEHVKKLEEEFIKELDRIELNCCVPIRSLLSSLQDKAMEINQMKSEIQNTKKYASELQTFLIMREVQEKTTEYDKYLRSSIENINHDTISIDSAIDTKINDILIVERFGSIQVNKSPSIYIVLKKRENRQAQIQVMVPKECKVTCCSYSEALVWEFEDKSVLDNPKGITVDNNGNVYVVKMYSCKVVVISPDGKQCREILTNKDGLDKPTAIFFDKVRKQLLVTNQKQFAYIFNISYV